MRAVPEPEDPATTEPDPENVTELRVPQQPEPEPEVAVAEPVPEEAPDVTEAAASTVEDAEVVDAVEVVDEPAPQAAAEGNGAAEETERPAEQRGFDGDEMLAARLVALQMAVAGSERIEVEAHLRKTFGLGEPGAILNDVFGTESKL
jgi:hypothetical protein